VVDSPVRVDLTPAQIKTRRRRSIALGLVLGGVVVLFYILTIVKMGPGVFNRAL
jgi:hypothetical protein